jgi:hypothetical protein
VERILDKTVKYPLERFLATRFNYACDGNRHGFMIAHDLVGSLHTQMARGLWYASPLLEFIPRTVPLITMA